MASRWIAKALAYSTALFVVTACDTRETPLAATAPSPPVIASASPPGPQNHLVTLGELVEFNLDPVVSGWACEIGNDPFPCAWFVVDVPRAGSAVIRLDSDRDYPMFIEVGNLAVAASLAFTTGGSPLVARAPVPAGALPFRVGFNLPWGRSGQPARLRLLVTLE